MITTEVNITELSKMLSEEYESYENKIIKLETVLRSAKVALQGIQKHSQNAYIDFACKQTINDIEEALNGH